VPTGYWLKDVTTLYILALQKLALFFKEQLNPPRLLEFSWQKELETPSEFHSPRHLLRKRKLEIVSCPSCGRAQVDVYSLAEKVQAGLQGMTVPLRVAVMGCVVNGPGEAREADLGVASGNGKGQIFVRGQVIKTVPESEIVETLIEEAMRLGEEMEIAGVGSGEPTVTVR
jgi:dissimilatory sulfite reductase (desulfoviridin) alpha/beta subunit